MANLLFTDEEKLNKLIKLTKYRKIQKIKEKFSVFLLNCREKLFCFLDKIYYKLYQKRTIIDSTIKSIVLLLNIVLFINFIILVLLNKEYYMPVFYMFIVIFTYFIIKFINYYFYEYFGKRRVLNYEYLLTKEYLTEKLPKINKVYGKTGAGKDSLTVGISSILIDSMKSKLKNDLINLKDILFCFDFDKVDSVICKDYDLFLNYNYDLNKNNLINLIKKYKGFIKTKYKTSVNYNVLLEQWLAQLNNPLEYITENSYFDGIRYHAYYELLLEYILKYIRLNVEKNFLMSNQPIVEDIENNLMSKMFSLNFMQVKEMEIAYKKEDYISKMLFPWKNHMVIIETEAGSWYFNRDKENSRVLYDSGVRDFKAYNRHFIDDLYWFINDQDSSRVDKLLRELDHNYIQVLNKSVLFDKTIKLFFLEKKAKRFSKLITKNNKKCDYLNEVIYLLKKRIKYYGLMNKSTSNLEKKLDKYKKKLFVLKNNTNINEKFKLINERIEEIKNNGFIKILVNISDCPTPVNLEKLSLISIINKETIFYHESYQIELTFKIKDIHGRYDTHYMKAVAENVSSKNKLVFNEVPRWDSSLKLNKKDILFMGYPTAFNMFGITKEDYIGDRFSVKDDG